MHAFQSDFIAPLGSRGAPIQKKNTARQKAQLNKSIFSTTHQKRLINKVFSLFTLGGAGGPGAPKLTILWLKFDSEHLLFESLSCKMYLERFSLLAGRIGEKMGVQASRKHIAYATVKFCFGTTSVSIVSRNIGGVYFFNASNRFLCSPWGFRGLHLKN